MARFVKAISFLSHASRPVDLSNHTHTIRKMKIASERRIRAGSNAKEKNPRLSRDTNKCGNLPTTYFLTVDFVGDISTSEEITKSPSQNYIHSEIKNKLVSLLKFNGKCINIF